MVAFYIPSQTPVPTNVIFMSGGNGMTALDFLPFIDRFLYTAESDKTATVMAVRSTAFFIVDYPGYGLNAGKPTLETTQGNVSYALRILEHYLGQKIAASSSGVPPPQHIPTHFFGFSLGCRLSLSGALYLQRKQLYHQEQLQRNKIMGNDDQGSNFAPTSPPTTPPQPLLQIGSVIMDSPFNSMKSLVSNLLSLPMALVHILLRHNYDNVEGLKELYENQSKLGQNHIPVHIIHSTEDDIIPYPLAQDLFLSYINNHYECEAKGNNGGAGSGGGSDDGNAATTNHIFDRNDLVSDPTETIHMEAKNLKTPLYAFFSNIDITQHKFQPQLPKDKGRNGSNGCAAPSITLTTITDASHNEALSDSYALVPYKALTDVLR